MAHVQHALYLLTDGYDVAQNLHPPMDELATISVSMFAARMHVSQIDQGFWKLNASVRQLIKVSRETFDTLAFFFTSPTTPVSHPAMRPTPHIPSLQPSVLFSFKQIYLHLQRLLTQGASIDALPDKGGPHPFDILSRGWTSVLACSLELTDTAKSLEDAVYALLQAGSKIANRFA